MLTTATIDRVLFFWFLGDFLPAIGNEPRINGATLHCRSTVAAQTTQQSDVSIITKRQFTLLTK